MNNKENYKKFIEKHENYTKEYYQANKDKFKKKKIECNICGKCISINMMKKHQLSIPCQMYKLQEEL